MNVLLYTLWCTSHIDQHYIEKLAALRKQYPGNVDSNIQGIPSVADTCWLVSDDYINLYSKQWKIPLVVSYQFNSATVSIINRSYGKFKADVRLTNNIRSKDKDYTNSGYTRGHMANAGTYSYTTKYIRSHEFLPNLNNHAISFTHCIGDFKSSLHAYISTYLYSNMAPQTEPFNSMYRTSYNRNF